MLLRPRQRLVAVLNAATNAAVVAVLQQMPSHKSETVAPRLSSLAGFFGSTVCSYVVVGFAKLETQGGAHVFSVLRMLCLKIFLPDRPLRLIHPSGIAVRL